MTDRKHVGYSFSKSMAEEIERLAKERRTPKSWLVEDLLVMALKDLKEGEKSGQK